MRRRPAAAVPGRDTTTAGATLSAACSQSDVKIKVVATKPMRGRKLKRESRAAEFRQKLIDWKQTTESLRPSLRALASELATSHQLLSWYLARYEEWRPRYPWEGLFQHACRAALARMLRKLRAQARRGELSAGAIRMLGVMATQGPRRGAGSARSCTRENLPSQYRARAKSFRSEWR